MGKQAGLVIKKPFIIKYDPQVIRLRMAFDPILRGFANQWWSHSYNGAMAAVDAELKRHGDANADGQLFMATAGNLLWAAACFAPAAPAFVMSVVGIGIASVKWGHAAPITQTKLREHLAERLNKAKAMMLSTSVITKLSLELAVEARKDANIWGKDLRRWAWNHVFAGSWDDRFNWLRQTQKRRVEAEIKAVNKHHAKWSAYINSLAQSEYQQYKPSGGDHLERRALRGATLQGLRERLEKRYPFPDWLKNQPSYSSQKQRTDRNK